MAESKALIKRIIKPPALKPGDKVGIACPASRPYSREAVPEAIALVEELGFVPVMGKHVLSIDGCFAGTDDERLADLHSFIADRSIAAIFCLSGGYGAVRLLSKLDFNLLKEHPKLIVGPEDVSALLLGIFTRLGLVSFFGPSLERITSRHSFERFSASLQAQTVFPPLRVENQQWLSKQASHLKIGESKHSGTVIGGNINALITIMGTEFCPDFNNAILCLDDLDERNDSLERWMTALYISGALDKLKACAFGKLEGCGPRGTASVRSWQDSYYERFEQLPKPACFGFTFGDSTNGFCLPIGLRATLDVDQGLLEFHESAFA